MLTLGSGFIFEDGIHWEWRKGTCDIEHGWCICVPRGGAQSLATHELTQEISTAVAAEDIASLARYANMPSVSLFLPRSAIQVLSCDGETIAGHIPVSPRVLSAVEAAAAESLDPDA